MPPIDKAEERPRTTVREDRDQPAPRESLPKVSSAPTSNNRLLTATTPRQSLLRLPQRMETVASKHWQSLPCY